jgi:nucleoside-diphosphate-sugar epimerase
VAKTRFLLLGGTGFIGHHVTRKLVSLGHDVSVFHRGQSEPVDMPGSVRHFHGDRFDLAPHVSVLRKNAPDVVIDTYAEGQSDARAVAQAFSGVAQRLIALSSADVYMAYDIFRGRESRHPVPVPIPEDGPLRQRMYPYQETQPKYEKILAEREFVARPDQLPATVLRLPGVYGPGDPQRRFGGWVKRMLNGRAVILIGPGEAEWRFCRGYVENVADAIVLAATDGKVTDRIYNVSEPDAPTEREWVELIGRIIGWHGAIVVVPDAELPVHLLRKRNWDQSWELDTSRIRSELDYRERVDRVESLRRTINWLENHLSDIDIPADYYREEDQIGRRFHGSK